MSRVITDTAEIQDAMKRVAFLANAPANVCKEWLEGIKLKRAEGMSGSMVRLLEYGPGQTVMSEGEWAGNNFCVLVEGTLDVYMKEAGIGSGEPVNEVRAGESFGEMSLFAGVPRTASVVVPKSAPSGVPCKALVLEIARPALRSAGKDKEFANALFKSLGKIYRLRGLDTAIEELRQAGKGALSTQQLDELQAMSKFRVYGRSSRLCQKNSEIKELVLIRNGWVRREPDIAFPVDRGEGVVTAAGSHIDFSGAGHLLGREAFSATEAPLWPYGAIVMLRTEVVEIKLASLRAKPELFEAVRRALGKFPPVNGDELERSVEEQKKLKATEDLVTSGIIEAENVLVMDMDLCVRCGNCSLACQKVHGQSRLVRRGINITRPKRERPGGMQHVLVPQVCIHCQDPECLTYCPTGAIDRRKNGQIDINEKTCTGCLQCAMRCPYNAITMVSDPSARQSSGLAAQLTNWLPITEPVLPQARLEQPLTAIKCNLCENTSLNPPGKRRRKPAYSCEENCPTGALVRVNPREYFDEVQPRLGFIFQSPTMAVSRNIHRRDRLRGWFHFAGAHLLLITLVGGLWLWWGHGFNERLSIVHMTLRWLTGWMGGAGIVLALFYSVRRRIYRHRAGPLRYWMLAHAYLGAVAAMAIALHGGSHGGGKLTSALMFSFDGVLASGLFGMATYYGAPRLLTKIEGDPLLLEDLQARRVELRTDLARGAEQNQQYQDLLDGPRRRFASFGYLLKQICRPQELTAMWADVRDEYGEQAKHLIETERKQFLAAVENLLTIRRLDALICLHKLLKLWLLPHIITTLFMLALLVIHIVQVTLFAVR
jgi:Fe-S-cluster-containing dehydrogenase component